MNTYELQRKQSNYKYMKEYIVKMLNILSKSDLIDNLSDAQNCLKNNYVIDNSAVKVNTIEKQKQKIRDSIYYLQRVKDSLDYQVRQLQTDIETANASGGI